MKQVIESYVGIWIIMLLFILAMAFTIINLNVIQARKIYSDIKAEVQASNGSIIPEGQNRAYVNSRNVVIDGERPYTIENGGYQYEYSIIRESIVDAGIQATDETFIYNSLYKVSLKYEYYVPLFGKQIYPITGYAY